MEDAGLNFQLLFEESPDVLLVLLPDSPRFTMVAATKQRLLATHTTKEQILGRGLFEIFPDNPDDPSATGTANLRASLERVLATKAPDTMAVQKYDIALPNGQFEVKYWSPRNIPVLSATGDVQYILHRAVDVSDLARASEEGQELRGRTADMEREVVRRSLELDAANRRLREANEQLSQLDAAKTAFFSNISHEFRTPLTLLLGPLQDSLTDAAEPLSSTQRWRLQVANDNANRLLKLVTALLDFSRIEAGRMRGSFTQVDLAAVTRNLVGMFRTAFDRAGLSLTLECPTLTEAVWVDLDMWEKIVPNLLSNAFKFTLAGGVRVRLLDTPGSAVLEVIDTGTGIAEAELPRVFERFHRVAGAVGRTHEGTGIGLALVRELVGIHGGTIQVHSALGEGSTFRVEIPKGSAHLPSDSLRRESPFVDGAEVCRRSTFDAAQWTSMGIDSRAAPNAAAGAEEPAGKAENPAGRADDPAAKPLVLVVDDNADLRAYMSGLLTPHYRVMTANDGRAALDVLAEQVPDIILSDVMMPRMTGMELVHALRSDANTADVPIILLSARAGEESTVEGLDAGCDDYLIKPFTAQELLARVRAHVRLAQSRRKFTAGLESANRELDAFSYSVAHDLRGPLRSVEGFSDMLLQENADELSEEGRRRLAIVSASVRRMSQLIDDLLRLAQMGRREVRRIPFELSSVVRTVALQIQQGKGSSPRQLSIEDGVNVNADPHLMQIVLENLLGNAWKFTSKRDDGRIEFGSARRDSEICYFIRDNGAGFNMQYADKLFTPFQRLHSEGEFQGTGVGLATVKRIVSRHGGRVWAEAEVDKGATFYFTLGEPAELDRALS
jgi:signal transduction histidine kinase